MKPIRRVATEEKTLFLTFDDGPVAGCTEKVLDLLAVHGAKASFFVIGSRAEKEPQLLKRILSEGHAIGNHSWDHRYRNFFRGRKRIRHWIEKAEFRLQDLTGRPTVGFRSPAGVLTPPLLQAVAEIEIPLVHWNVRFYDTVFRPTAGRVVSSLESAPKGSIVLLHDSHLGSGQAWLLDVLKTILPRLRTGGWDFKALPKR